MIKQIAVAIVFNLAPVALAQTYIVPDGDCGAITLHATRGTGSPIAADRLKDAYVYLPPHRVELNPAAGSGSLDFHANVTEGDKVVMASVDLKPEISGKETRTEHAKAFVFCGPAPLADWQFSAVSGLEIIPQDWNGRRPQLKAGDTMRFIAVDTTTRKILDVPMDLYRAGAGFVAHGRHDMRSGMDFRYPEPGRYLVTTTYRRPDPQQPALWLVDTSTLTFEVK
ncbi:MAG TPA: hypothetical protein VNN25_06265 [Thermoanaerobaculia bacterium]|nr:hypothetical protein [Thermoanaerobaculia bacterium]